MNQGTTILARRTCFSFSTSMPQRKKDDATTPWQDLPPELLFDVSARLNCVATYVTFACVCRSWRACAKVASGNFAPSQPPMLVQFLDHDDTLLFYGILQNKVYHKRMEGFDELCYVGHKHGFLVMTMDSRDVVVILINPFTEARIQVELPRDALSDKLNYVLEGTLFAPPDSSDCLLFLIVNGSRALCYQFRSRSWKWLPLPRGMFSKHVVVVKNKAYIQMNEDLLGVMDMDIDARTIAATPVDDLIKRNSMPPRHPFDKFLARIMEKEAGCGL